MTSSFTNATIEAKANIYFDGNVTSHSLRTAEGESKSIGIIRPGSYHFGTAAAERMEIIAGACEVTLDGQSETQKIEAGSHFDVAANSGFTIVVAEGLCEYICSYIEA